MSLREVKSLRKLNHENVVKLKEVVRTNNDLFFVFEYVEKNLYQVQKEHDNNMDIDDIKKIMYEILQGLSYIHKNGFFHRDMKPENVLMNGMTVKIADFGLAREIRSKPPYTDYVSTRWYRAPELLLRSTNYSSPVDIFAAGCMFAELLLGRPLFAGKSEGDQLMKICSVLGPPSKLEWPEGHKLASKLGYDFPKMAKTPLEDMLPNATPEALDLLEKMFTYDPNIRITAQKCLGHEFFDGYEPAKTPSSRGNLFNINKNLSNKNNKFVSSKFMRMNSKKFDHERQPSPGISKTSEPDKSSAGKKLGYAKLGQMPGIRSDVGSGFYVKNKPIKSPGTPTSSTNSQALYKGNKFTTKKLGGGLPLYNQSSVPVHNYDSSAGKGSSGSPKASVNSLRFSRNSNNSITDSRITSSLVGKNHAPPPVPLGLSTNNSFSAYNNSSALGGGGLSRASGMGAGLGRHQI